MSDLKRFPVIGVCGLDCGLCPRYYTVGPSKCPGCAGADFSSKHPSCSFITCCVKKKNLEVCGECSEFPCTKFKNQDEYEQVSESASYPSYKKVLPNQHFIKENGIESFIEQQAEKIRILKLLLDNYDEGRSRSFFCKSLILKDISEVKAALKKASIIIEADKSRYAALKERSLLMRSLLK